MSFSLDLDLVRMPHFSGHRNLFLVPSFYSF
uniref:Uncharacterized protein n=1 Tax=Rhizophora mucronata TaxID=61149 RepID=A0A2P2QT45_RHIMU